jgi:hypothetical protein
MIHRTVRQSHASDLPEVVVLLLAADSMVVSVAVLPAESAATVVTAAPDSTQEWPEVPEVEVDRFTSPTFVIFFNFPLLATCWTKTLT